MCICLSMHLCVSVCLCICVYLSVCASVCMSVCASVCMSVCASVCACACMHNYRAFELFEDTYLPEKNSISTKIELLCSPLCCEDPWMLKAPD